ncbi:MAG: glycosyltransferase [Deltaproteobacteria bacterium]|nr:glycosyltransferase [Deltaproteobacteria bacterium]
MGSVSAERTRIGYVIGQLVRGGAERQLYELIRGLDQRRFRCIVYCLSEEILPYGDMIREAGVDLRIVKRRGHFEIARILKLAYLLRRDRIDIVHSFLFNANGYAWAARLLANVPYLVTSARSCKGLGWLRDWVNRIAFRMSDAIVCNGNAVRSFITQHYRAPAHKIKVVYNGVDLDRFIPGSTDSQPSGRPEDRLVITVGRLVPAKDLDLFLDAAALLAHKKAGVRFMIVGDGPCRETLEGNVSRNGLNGQVSFLGDRADVPQLLQAADIFWLTSAWEGLPNVLLEAMACAKPIVTRDVGACRELVSHGVNGYLVSSRDAEKFADHTLTLLSDPARATEMGDAGRRLAEEKFSIPAMIRTTEKLYSSLIQ